MGGRGEGFFAEIDYSKKSTLVPTSLEKPVLLNPYLGLRKGSPYIADSDWATHRFEQPIPVRGTMAMVARSRGTGVADCAAGVQEEAAKEHVAGHERAKW